MRPGTEREVGSVPGAGEPFPRKSLNFSLLLIYLLVAWLGVSGAFWIFQVFFLGEVSEGRGESMSMAKGFVTLVIFSVVILGSLLSIPSPLEAVEDDLEDERKVFDRSRRERNRVLFLSLWYVRMRWVAIISAVALLVLSIGIMGWLPKKVVPGLFSILVMLIVFNLSLQRFLLKGRLPKHILLIQAFTDLLSLTGMLHFTGGLENPLVILILFHVVIAGIILTPRECYMVAGAASLLLAAMASVEWSGIVEHYTLAIVPHGHDLDMHASKDARYAFSMTAIYSIALFLSAYFTTKIMSQSRANEERIHGMAMEKIETQKILEQSLDSTQTAIRVLDGGKRTKWRNRIWEQWFGDGLEAYEEAEDAEAGVLEDRIPRTIEIEGTEGPEGRKVFFRLQIAAIDGLGGEDAQIVELASDITSEKEEQVQMIRAEQLAAVGKLASHVAHEVNNPVTIMGAKARLLLSKYGSEVPAKVSSDLKKIADLSDRVAEIAQGLLGYSRPSPKKWSVFDLRKVVRGSLDLVKQELILKKTRTGLDLPDEPAFVNGNEAELSQVFLNVLMNSIDAIAEGGEIRVSLERMSRHGHAGFCVRFRDSGDGIPPEIREKIFEPFFTTKEPNKGTGLGLSISFSLVKAHGGHMEAASERGKGAVFEVWIPEFSGEVRS